jgi:hypothetical protein
VDLKKLEGFHNKAMRHILCISKWHQASTRLTNENLRKKMDYIATMEEVIDERRLDWLGNMARQSDNKLPKRFLTAWIMNPRKSGGQKHIIRDYNARAINQMLVYNGIDSNPSKECPFKAWIRIAKNVDQWKSMVYKRRHDRMELKKADGVRRRTEATVTEGTKVTGGTETTAPTTLPLPHPARANSHPPPTTYHSPNGQPKPPRTTSPQNQTRKALPFLSPPIEHHITGDLQTTGTLPNMWRHRNDPEMNGFDLVRRESQHTLAHTHTKRHTHSNSKHPYTKKTTITHTNGTPHVQKQP